LSHVGHLSDDRSFTRRLFSKAGYSVALIARGADSVTQLAEELNATGGDVCTLKLLAGVSITELTISRLLVSL